jgi:nitroreductase
MIKGSSTRRAAHPIHPLFVDRWSARAMSGEPLTPAELLPLFEAARWAPSAHNFQPWRMLYALRDTPHWQRFFDLLNPSNQVWAQRGGALVLFIARQHFDNGKPCLTHSYDAGAAWLSFALQAFVNGLAVHGLQGFDYARARIELAVPEAFSVEAMAVVGRPGDEAQLPEELRRRETPNDRRPLAQTICEGVYSLG